MDTMIIHTKLDSLHRCLQRIQSKTPGSLESLARDLDLQDIITLNLSRAVQVCVDIAAHLITDFDVPPPSSMAESFDKLAQVGVIPASLSDRMKKTVGFRNITIHEYEKIDWLIVFKIITEHLHDFSDYARVVVEWMEKEKP